MSWVAVFGMGILLGLLGGGGGILTVPILVGFFGMAATEATGASLFVVGVASVIGAAQGFLRREVEVGAALLIAVPSAVGAFLARAVLVPRLPSVVFGLAKDDFLLVAFALLMVVVGLRMLKRPPEGSDGRVVPRVVIAALGFLIGLVSGTLGAGGGFLIVPALTLLLGLDIRRAIPTSLTVIALQSLVGFAGELGNPVAWDVLLPVLGVGLLGLLVGMPLRERAPKDHLRVGFAMLVFVVAMWMAVRVVS